jgi:hypothetical protein
MSEMGTKQETQIETAEWRAILSEFRVIPAIFIAAVAFHFIRGYLTFDPRIYRT